MAADVTLISVPDTDHWRRHVETRRGRRCDSDCLRVVTVDHTAIHIPGERCLVETSAAPNDPDYRWFPVGPLSSLKAALHQDAGWLPGPTWALHLALTEPRVMTPALRAELMVHLNRPDRSHYKSWKRRAGRSLGRRVGRHRWVYRGERRVAKRQHVKRWLEAQDSRLVWAESW